MSYTAAAAAAAATATEFVRISLKGVCQNDGLRIMRYM